MADQISSLYTTLSSACKMESLFFSSWSDDGKVADVAMMMERKVGGMENKKFRLQKRLVIEKG